VIRDHATFNILLDSIRRFVRERLIPAERQVAGSGGIPAALVGEMREMGLFN
jgi:acyl-CoA dehydrogenase